MAVNDLKTFFFSPKTEPWLGAGMSGSKCPPVAKREKCGLPEELERPSSSADPGKSAAPPSTSQPGLANPSGILHIIFPFTEALGVLKKYLIG